jgi:hypothetical protein
MRPANLARAARYYRLKGHIDTAESYEAELRDQGRCRQCGRPLRDPESMARGTGPECAAKVERVEEASR